ncbi:carbohydrate-binding module family 20 protein [Biscogniauxia marginata]|nr:carbohydrate-binding module family 20 protein [Biscogniauxia marginata]
MGGLILKAIAGLAVVANFGTASASNPRGALDVFIQKQRAIALQGTLNNIGPNGSLVPGAGAGYIVASPSKVNPDYFYTWSRDAALTMKMIVDEFILGNKGLQQYVEDYIHSQAVLQTVTNPSGTFLPSGAGLGEPKYKVDGTRYNGAWGRPQRDGPALRAIALITYSNWLVSNGQKGKARTVVWPVISNDLSYVGQYWNATGFDLWEEVNGSSFFTTQNQYRALVEGAQLARTLGVNCTGCDQVSQVQCFLQQAYWNGEYFIANINVNNGRTGKDANTILGPIALFDVNAKCDDPSIQPCSSRGLSNFKALIDSFRNTTLYPINQGIPKDKGIAVGRYTEDVYYGGNPWYLIIAAAAEYLYDAVAQWKTQGYLTIDKTSIGFFKDIYPGAQTKTYRPKQTRAEFSRILKAITAYADSFVEVVQKYTPQNGSLSEQFNKTLPGNPLSAHDLTWSYAAFITMASRRAGEFPPPWVSSTAASAAPAQCSPTSSKGAYAPALAAGAPNATASCTSTVRFQVNASTYYGENVYVAGSSADLGAWDLAGAWPLDAAGYTAERPLWSARVALAAGETVAYAYVRQQDCGQDPIWETRNRTLVVPACDEGADPEVVRLETDDAWTGPVGSSGGCPGSGTG